VFLQRKALLALLSITRYYTDSRGAYRRHRTADAHQPGPCNTEKIARKPLTWRTRIARLMCKTLCFLPPIQLHDMVIELFVNRYACGLRVRRKKDISHTVKF
jgi:insertion element IS1 protein InsB